MRPAILSGIVTWDVSVSYWPIFSHAPLRKLTRPRLFFVYIVTIDLFTDTAAILN